MKWKHHFIVLFCVISSVWVWVWIWAFVFVFVCVSLSLSLCISVFEAGMQLFHTNGSMFSKSTACGTMQIVLIDIPEIPFSKRLFGRTYSAHE